MQTTIAPLDAKVVAALYDSDLVAWASTNAELLRQGKFQQADMGHVIEEIEDMGKSDLRSLASHLRNLLMHLLKWQYQPHIKSQSWQISVINARAEIEQLLLDSPSLRVRLPELIQTQYPIARRFACVDTLLPIQKFPDACPYQLENVLDQDWLPPDEN